MPSRRRLFVAFVALFIPFFIWLYFGSTPGQLSVQSPEPDEIFGLLHFVTSADEAGRELIDPEEPIELAWYAQGSIANERGWEARLAALPPLVVFSKSYCPYSKRAKKLLKAYDVSPSPEIVEVDLRADSSEIKMLLTRLTGRSTFPNIILHGRSLGGSDDLVELHEQGKLREVMEKGGVEVNAGEESLVGSAV